MDTKLQDGTYEKEKNCPTLTFIGHASVKIKSAEGDVIYIDPFYPSDEYKESANYILMTHAHSDHTNYQLCTQAPGCKIIRWSDALIDGKYQIFESENVHIEAVPSGGNKNHDVSVNVGYIVTVDGVSVYHAGDTSMSDGKYTIAKKKIDYAMYPVDGFYNMGPEEATEVANLVGATHNIAIHGYQEKSIQQFEEFAAKGKLFMKPGETITLEQGK